MRQFNLISLFALTALLLFSFGCNSQQEQRELIQNQLLLDEANNLIELRELPRAKKTLEKAVNSLNDKIAKQPGNPGLQLQRAQALLAYFTAENLLTIEQAPIHPQSLMRIPSPSDYTGYHEYIARAMADVDNVLSSRQLSYEKKAAAYTLLASIYRLKEDTMARASNAYEKAIDNSVDWLNEIRTTKGKKKPLAINIHRVEEQVHLLQIARVETLLAIQDWEEALTQLEEARGGKDLKFFAIQIEFENRRISDFQQKINEDFERNRGASRLSYQSDKKRTRTDELQGLNAYETALWQSELRLTDLKNNLIYRIICYYNLDDKRALEEARKILKHSYPYIETELTQQLEGIINH
ncbi:hypothetical protein JYU14_00045 [Simkania negevensis]|uniref:Uncharacterized protein n=1 Tax=Simkania negevensis TaxID=83561 RepID=A0ABS3AQ67_9BACT|nr:hypothetical protein [Simkania negevensis]